MTEEEEREREQSAYDDRLRRRLRILQERLSESKVAFAPGLSVVDSLRAVRRKPDGEIDLDTVDGLVRALALAVAAQHDRAELKKGASLNEIQNAYFEFIERNFGEPYRIMTKRGASPHDVAQSYAKDTTAAEELTKDLTEFVAALDSFWHNAGEAAHVHVEDAVGNVKGVFGGDLFPVHDENIASKCGIYTDTVVLPDPFLRSKHLFEQQDVEKRAYYLIKHGLNILQYRDLACVDAHMPIVAIVPDRSALDAEEKEFCSQLGKEDALMHAERMFGREFQSNEEVMEFARALDTPDKFLAEVRDESRILFDTQYGNEPAVQIRTALESEFCELIGVRSPGVLFVLRAIGSMGISNELLVRAGRLKGTPIIDAPTSWQYFSWKMEYDGARAALEVGDAKELHVVRGLQALADNEMQWLGNVPPDALLDIRKQGAMDEIRGILGQGIAELVKANPANVHRTRDTVFDNLSEAFRQHRRNISELREKKWKFAGKDIGSWFVTGSLGVAAAATGAPVWALGAIAADQLLGAPKLKDIPKTMHDLAEESKKLHRSPVGMLFDISEKLGD